MYLFSWNGVYPCARLPALETEPNPLNRKLFKNRIIYAPKFNKINLATVSANFAIKLVLRDIWQGVGLPRPHLTPPSSVRCKQRNFCDNFKSSNYESTTTTEREAERGRKGQSRHLISAHTVRDKEREREREREGALPIPLSKWPSELTLYFISADWN